MFDQPIAAHFPVMDVVPNLIPTLHATHQPAPQAIATTFTSGGTPQVTPSGPLLDSSVQLTSNPATGTTPNVPPPSPSSPSIQITANPASGAATNIPPDTPMPTVPQASQSSPTPQVPGSTNANIHPGNTTGNMEPSTSTTTLDDDAEVVSECVSVMPCDADVAKHCKRIQELKKNKYHCTDKMHVGYGCTVR